uniref:Uncharacterized protein n=1 Tax=Syphacia muris TaxID=451379 RepID=A0A0N5AT56_9BILA
MIDDDTINGRSGRELVRELLHYCISCMKLCKRMTANVVCFIFNIKAMQKEALIRSFNCSDSMLAPFKTYLIKIIDSGFDFGFFESTANLNPMQFFPNPQTPDCLSSKYY